MLNVSIQLISAHILHCDPCLRVIEGPDIQIIIFKITVKLQNFREIKQIHEFVCFHGIFVMRK